MSASSIPEFSWTGLPAGGGAPNAGGFITPKGAGPEVAGMDFPTPKAGDFREGVVACGLISAAVAAAVISLGFLYFVGKVNINLVPGSDFSATAPPPCPAKMVFTSANLRPVPANWADAVCLGS